MENKLSKRNDAILSLAKLSSDDRGKIAKTINQTAAHLNMQMVVQAAYLKGEDGAPIEPNIQTMRKWPDGVSSIETVIRVIMTRFISMNFNNDKESITDIVYDFTNNIFENRKDFTLLDIVYFIKYIKENVGRRPEMRVMGNTLSDLKLSEMFNCYVEDRAVEHEAYQKRIADQFKPLTTDRETKYIILSDGLYVTLTPDNGKTTIDYVEDKASATQVSLDKAYDVKRYLAGLDAKRREEVKEGVPEPRVISIKLAVPRPSILEYIKKNIPDFFQSTKKSDKEHPGIKFDEERTKKVLAFMKKSQELDQQQREELLREVEANNRKSKALSKK